MLLLFAGLFVETPAHLDKPQLAILPPQPPVYGDDVLVELQITGRSPPGSIVCLLAQSLAEQNEQECFADTKTISMGGFPTGTHVITATLEANAKVLSNASISFQVSMTFTPQPFGGLGSNLVWSVPPYNEEQDVQLRGMQDPESVFVDQLKEIAKEKLIILNLSDRNLMHDLIPWKTMLLKFGQRTYVNIAIDADTMEFCQKHSLTCVLWTGPPPSVIGYDKIKFTATLVLLNLGVDVFFSEMDVFWVQNPLDYLLREDGQQWKNTPCHWCFKMGGAQAPYPSAEVVDVQVSAHALSSRVNIGVYLIRSNDRTKRFMKQLLVAGKSHFFNQYEFDSLLGNMDIAQPDTQLMQASGVSWKKLDYNFFAGGDGVDTYEHLVTIHTFSPMSKDNLKVLHAGQTWAGFPPLLRRPSQFYYYIKRSPGIFHLHLTKQPSSTPVKPIVQISREVMLTNDTQICVGDPRRKTDNECADITENPLFHKYRLNKTIPAPQWSPGAIVRGAGMRVSYTLYAVSPPPPGNYRLTFWVQQRSKALLGRPVTHALNVLVADEASPLDNVWGRVQQKLLLEPTNNQLQAGAIEVLMALKQEVQAIKVAAATILSAKRPYDRLVLMQQALKLPVVIRNQAVQTSLIEMMNATLIDTISMLERLKLAKPVMAVDGLHKSPGVQVLSVQQSVRLFPYQQRNMRQLTEVVLSFYRAICPGLMYVAPQLRNTQQKGAGKFRIGFLSTYINHSEVAKLFGPLMVLLGLKYEVVVFTPDDSRYEDAGTTFYTKSAHKRVKVPLTGSLARTVIAKEAVDILIFLELGEVAWTHLFALGRLAPVQVALLSALHTSGSQQMDYFIASEYFPPKEIEFTEQVIRFATTSFFFMNPLNEQLNAQLHPVFRDPLQHRLQFGFSPEDHVYVVAHSVERIHPAFDGVIQQILQRDSKAKFALLIDSDTKADRTEQFKHRLRALQRHRADQIVFLPHTSDRASLFTLLLTADVVLDPFPFGGGTVSIEAFALGTPIVTSESLSKGMCLVAGMYRRMEIHGLIVESKQAYSQLAVAIARNRGTSTSDLRQRIRTASSRLFNDAAVVDEWEQFISSTTKQHRLRATT